MQKVIVIVGPTGVGKTKMGIALAQRLHGEIISGDSMQVYQGMNIGTAKVTKEQMQGVKHHLIDIKSPQESYSVAQFQEETRKKIDEIASLGHLPLIVGGTGLYIKAALYDYHFEQEVVDHTFFEKKYALYTDEQLHQYLATFDLDSAKNIHCHNRRRVLRAIEIYEKTGKTKSEALEKQKHELMYDVAMIGLTLPRDELYQRINERVDQMVDDGLEKEVMYFIEQGYDASYQSMKAIGYKEWFDYKHQKQSLEETIALIKQHSRQYARRQYTWFNHQFDMKWYQVSLTDFDQTIDEVYQDLKLRGF